MRKKKIINNVTGEPLPYPELAMAADVIEKRGLTSGTLEREDGTVCVLGALSIVYYNHSKRGYDNALEKKPAVKALKRAIFGDPDDLDYPRSLDYWNDRTAASQGWNYARAQKLIVGTLRKAAAGEAS